MSATWKSIAQTIFTILFLTNLAVAEPALPYQIQPYDSAGYESIQLGRDGRPSELRPKEIYGTSPHIGIRIANGGAGYTGLLRALSEAYLKTKPTIHGQPFSIAWYATNTTYSYYALRDHVVDLSLVYEIWPDALQGPRAYAQRPKLLFHDAFIFVGPVGNPAGLVPASAKGQGDSLDEILDKIITTGCKQPFAANCSMYASRSDLSGTYKKETAYLIAHRTPVDLVLNSPWYYAKPATPREALQEASAKGLYTMNDKSTWISQPAFQKDLVIFADGALGLDVNLNNPCYALLAQSQYLESDQPRHFLRWLTGPEGQRIIATYGQKEFGAPVVRAKER